jgi:outer membrane protein assembly factor BamB
MVTRSLLALMFFLLISVNQVFGQFSQWRGPLRNGIYPESGLKQTWPLSGPNMLWSFEGLGMGYGNVGLGKDKIFILGMPDYTGVLYTFDYNGKLIRKKEYGPEWYTNYSGSRSTPVVIGDLVYFESGRGTVYCYSGSTGNKLWSVDLLKRFDGKNITWGMTENLLIEGDRLYCTPGGKKNNIVALNRFTGETIWTSPGNHQPSAYCSPILIKHNKASLIVTMTQKSIIGVDARTGQFYWQVPQFQSNNIHANNPVYSDGIIYCSSDYAGDNSGLVALELSDDGRSVSVKWRNLNFKNLMGGIILSDGHIYGSIYKRHSWCCVDASDGEILYTSTAFGDGNIIMADGLFYCYSERGEAGLINANPSSLKLISKFRVPLGTGPHWAHSVIHNGRLYIRHGNALMVYKIKN